MKTKGLKTLVWLLAALLVLALPVVTGLAEESEREYDYILDDSGDAVITRYQGAGGHLQIPMEFGDYSVAGIGEYAFSNNHSVTGLAFPDTLQYIESGAFRGCRSLSGVRFGGGLYSIDSSAFENTALVSVKLPDSLRHLGDRAYANCMNLKEVYLPRGLNEIGSDVFSGCPKLTLKVYKGSPGHAYAQNNNLRHIILAESISLPANARVLKGSYLQLQASVEPPEASQEVTWSSSDDNIATVDDKGLVIGGALGTATITATAKDGSGVKAACSMTVYSKTFADFTYDVYPDCVKITGYTGSAAEVTVPGEIEGKPVTRIGDDAFENKTGITRVVLPGSIQAIDFNAFSGCRSLASINLPEGLHSLEGNAFSECRQLADIKLPASLTRISWGVFYQCSLTSIQIPEGVTVISNSVFNRCRNLTTVILPKGLTKIERYPFMDCTSLASITIPDGVTSIGEGAFYNCNSLRDIKLSGSLTSIDSRAFHSCKSLNRITIRAHVISFGWDVFKDTPVTIYGDVPSAAKDYADKNSIPFVDLAKGIPGDANDDLEVDTLDLISFMDYLVKGTPCPSMKNADADGSGGKPDVKDFAWIVNELVK